MSRRKVILSLNPVQFADLEALMAEDGQDNFTFYGAYLINQEKKRREGERSKSKVGRPKSEPKEQLWYPCPDTHGTMPYTEDELRGYYEIRGEKMPPLPIPYTKEELKKWPELMG